MKVNLAKTAGFCFGVKRAMRIALETAKNKKPVYMLGDIVHNQEVVAQIRRCGIKKITRLSCGKGKILLIRAHGCAIKTIEKALKLGYQIIDATCPMVKEIHRIARTLEDRNLSVIIIGDKRHDEVSGIMGQLQNKPLVIENIENIPWRKLNNITAAGVVVQSTQNVKKVEEILDILRKHIKKVKFHNTICHPTRIKRAEIKNLPLENNVVIIIGSKESANTRRIYEISKSLNKKSYWVNSSKEIKKSWLAKAQSVGITAGASTPESAIQKVVQKITDLSRG